MLIKIPEFCVVALVGASGSGKSTFALKHFRPTEVLSSDFFRGMVCDDENDQSATGAAFESLYYVANKRLDAGRLVVIDATNVQKTARDKIIGLAKEQDCLAVAIVLDLDPELCLERNKLRANRRLGPRVIASHARDLRQSMGRLQREGFRHVFVLKSPEEVERAQIVREKLWNDRREESGPFDIIGDVHGCYDELCALLEKMSYAVDKKNHAAAPPAGRKAVFLGDLCDRGPKNAEVLRLVMGMVEKGQALCVPGNHDAKLLRYLRTGKGSLTHGLDVTVERLQAESPEFRNRVCAFIDSLVSHYVLDGGRLIVAHAGLKEKLQGRSSGRVRGFCLYGETTGETDEFGLPVRINWAEEYRGKALVVYGHTPATEAQKLNNTVCIDTGCVFGGRLTAYRYPEGELAQVPAAREYCAPVKPLDHDGSAQDHIPNVRDVLGRRYVETRLYGGITVREENAAAALETMGRFAASPNWLIYLPPAMSPCETSPLPDYLEHPLEAFEYYKKRGTERVVCEQKHMGSRAVITLCRNAQTAAARFGARDGGFGIIHTRTGRRFFDGPDAETEPAILRRLQTVLEQTGFWDRFETGWVCLDVELMPWSAKAQKLLTEQYVPVGQAGRAGLQNAIDALRRAEALQTDAFRADENAAGQNADLSTILASYASRLENLEKYVAAYGKYCWNVAGTDDYRIAPFHVLATEGKVWNDENHLTHMSVVKEFMTGPDPIFVATNHVSVELHDESAVADAVDWWLELTASGGEGMVVKPLDFIARGKTEMLQPAIKCRGREYLRIIYGPEYTRADHMETLKKRSLSKKRRLAMAEFSLGMEALERFVRREPPYRVHECVFAVLAMESEPVDPRL